MVAPMAAGDDAITGIIEGMRRLGFTSSDARAYAALLDTHPATGYELAARSGVPRSAIYGVLRGLAAAGIVNEVAQKPARYVPLPPERLLESLSLRFERDLGRLREGLERLGGSVDEPATWSVQGYAAMVDQATALIRSAERSVHVSLWAREGAALAGALGAARDRGVDVILFSFNTLPTGLGEAFCYGIAEAELEPHWRHRILLVADHERLLVGAADRSERSRAVITEDPALVEMAVNNLVLDVTLLGERTGTDVGPAVARLTAQLAPIEELVERSLGRG